MTWQPDDVVGAYMHGTIEFRDLYPKVQAALLAASPKPLKVCQNCTVKVDTDPCHICGEARE